MGKRTSLEIFTLNWVLSIAGRNAPGTAGVVAVAALPAGSAAVPAQRPALGPRSAGTGAHGELGAVAAGAESCAQRAPERTPSP